MKNIHILPTDNPSRVYSKDGNYKLDSDTMAMDWYISSAGYRPQNLYITSDEEIKEGDWCLFNGLEIVKCTYSKNGEYLFSNPLTSSSNHHFSYFKKIILTTDLELQKDGVQAIDDEFLEWFVKNPSCEEVKVESKITKDGVWTDLKGYVELPTTHSIIHKIIIPKEENIWKKS